jgi:hypothetical protein
MLEKSSMFMMLLIVTASLVGISSIHQYVEGQTPPPPPAATPQPQQAQKAESAKGRVLATTISESSAGKRCVALVLLPDKEPNNLGLEPGTIILLSAPSESFCTLFGLSKIGKTQIGFDGQKISASSVPPAYRVTQVIL